MGQILKSMGNSLRLSSLTLVLIKQRVESLNISTLESKKGRSLPGVGKGWMNILINDHNYQLDKKGCRTNKVDNELRPIHPFRSLISDLLSLPAKVLSSCVWFQGVGGRSSDRRSIT